MSERRRVHSAGFSLVELLVVVAIIAVISAVAIPTVLTMTEDFKLRSAAMDVSTLVQRARSTAVSQNAPAALRFTGTTFYVDANNDNVMQTTENARYNLDRGMAVATTGQPASITNTLLGNSSTATVNVAGTSTPVYFNARGIPCPFNAGRCVAAGSATSWVYYLRDTRLFGTSGWAAITVSPAGRVRIWTWNGTAWK